MIQARVQAGLAHAKAHKTKTGRAIGRRRITAVQEAVIRTDLVADTGIIKTAKLAGHPRSVLRIRNELLLMRWHAVYI